MTVRNAKTGESKTPPVASDADYRIVRGSPTPQEAAAAIAAVYCRLSARLRRA